MKNLSEYIAEHYYHSGSKMVDKGNLRFVYQEKESGSYGKKQDIILDKDIKLDDLKKLTFEVPDVKIGYGNDGWSGPESKAYLVEIFLDECPAACKELEKNIKKLDGEEEISNYLNDIFANTPKDQLLKVRVGNLKTYFRTLKGIWVVNKSKW